MRREVSYLDLAKEAHSRGDRAGVMLWFKQHVRVMRKKRAAAETAANIQR